MRHRETQRQRERDNMVAGCHRGDSEKREMLHRVFFEVNYCALNSLSPTRSSVKHPFLTHASWNGFSFRDKAECWVCSMVAMGERRCHYRGDSHLWAILANTNKNYCHCPWSLRFASNSRASLCDGNVKSLSFMNEQPGSEQPSAVRVKPSLEAQPGRCSQPLLCP